MSHSRRNFLKNSSVFALGANALRPQSAFTESTEPLFPDGYPDRSEIIRAAIDSAITAGATYADARLSHQEVLAGVRVTNIVRKEHMAFGVRALYQGYWGFASSPVWSKDEAARLGLAAVAQAKANVLGRDRITELAPQSQMSSGHWEMPVKIDPFKIHPDEIADFWGGIMSYVQTLKFIASSSHTYSFWRTNKAFGSSLNQFTTQVLYRADGGIGFGLEDKSRQAKSGAGVEEISAAGQGFEYFRERPIREYIRKAHEEALHDLTLPVKPVDVGRFNLLINSAGVAGALHPSIGVATEVDRVFGFEANAGGTSYITEPETMLGSLKLGSSILNVTADRSAPGSIGLVKWDDEGIEPIKYDVVQDGILANLQTNIEGAPWIKDHYQRTGQELRSFGCAYAPTALDVQMAHNADLSIKPASTSDNQDSLRATLSDGLELRAPWVQLDFQQITGLMQKGVLYEIKQGKRVARFTNAGVLFRTPELWSNLTHLGGSESVRYYGLSSEKGQPSQSSTSGVFTPPAIFKEMTIIDVKRKA